jgi:hypothetical protein
VTERRRKRRNALLAYTALLVSGGMLVTVAQGNLEFADFLTTLGITLLLPVAIVSTQERLRKWTRRDSFSVAVAKRSAGYFSAITLAYLPVLWLTSSLLARSSPFTAAAFVVLWRRLTEAEFWFSGFLSVVAVVVAAFLNEVSRKLGPGVLWNWVRGRYHDPREEERVFMFLITRRRSERRTTRAVRARSPTSLRRFHGYRKNKYAQATE